MVRKVTVKRKNIAENPPPEERSTILLTRNRKPRDAGIAARARLLQPGRPESTDETASADGLDIPCEKEQAAANIDTISETSDDETVCLDNSADKNSQTDLHSNSSSGDEDDYGRENSIKKRKSRRRNSSFNDESDNIAATDASNSAADGLTGDVPNPLLNRRKRASKSKRSWCWRYFKESKRIVQAEEGNAKQELLLSTCQICA